MSFEERPYADAIDLLDQLAEVREAARYVLREMGCDCCAGPNLYDACEDLKRLLGITEDEL